MTPRVPGTAKLKLVTPSIAVGEFPAFTMIRRHPRGLLEQFEKDFVLYILRPWAGIFSSVGSILSVGEVLVFIFYRVSIAYVAVIIGYVLQLS
jgi:hypothetical protein